MSLIRWGVLPVLTLLAILTAIKYTVGQCPTSRTGNLRYRFYPSVSSGYEFIFCYGNSTVNYTCPSGFVYNPRSSFNDDSALCVARRVGPFTFDCSRNGNGQYTGDQTLYATCVNGEATLVNECPKGFKFMKTTGRCEIKCMNIGIFGISDQEYFTCSYDYRKYEFNMKNETCSQNTTFRDDYDVCWIDENHSPSTPSATTITSYKTGIYSITPTDVVSTEPTSESTDSITGFTEGPSVVTTYSTDTNTELTMIPASTDSITGLTEGPSVVTTYSTDTNTELTMIPASTDSITGLTEGPSVVTTYSTDTNTELTMIPASTDSITGLTEGSSVVTTYSTDTNTELTMIPASTDSITGLTEGPSVVTTYSTDSNTELTMLPASTDSFTTSSAEPTYTAEHPAQVPNHSTFSAYTTKESTLIPFPAGSPTNVDTSVSSTGPTMYTTDIYSYSTSPGTATSTVSLRTLSPDDPTDGTSNDVTMSYEPRPSVSPANQYSSSASTVYITTDSISSRLPNISPGGPNDPTTGMASEFSFSPSKSSVPPANIPTTDSTTTTWTSTALTEDRTHDTQTPNGVTSDWNTEHIITFTSSLVPVDSTTELSESSSLTISSDDPNEKDPATNTTSENSSSPTESTSFTPTNFPTTDSTDTTWRSTLPIDDVTQAPKVVTSDLSTIYVTHQDSSFSHEGSSSESFTNSSSALPPDDPSTKEPFTDMNSESSPGFSEPASSTNVPATDRTDTRTNETTESSIDPPGASNAATTSTDTPTCFSASSSSGSQLTASTGETIPTPTSTLSPFPWAPVGWGK